MQAAVQVFEMGVEIKLLEWDSAFFDLKIASIPAPVLDAAAWNRLLGQLLTDDVDVAYYFSAEPLGSEMLSVSSHNVLLVDQKTTFSKPVEKGMEKLSAIVPYSSSDVSPKLLELAVQSGAYSRFRVDEGFGKEKFEALYQQWIINSVNKQIAKEVLVYQDAEGIKGLVTLGEKHGKGDIGIIAVDHAARGMGIGRKLMTSAEQWFEEHTAFTEVQVVTQGGNAAACSLYRNCGYQQIASGYFYHIWKK